MQINTLIERELHGQTKKIVNKRPTSAQLASVAGCETNLDRFNNLR